MYLRWQTTVITYIFVLSLFILWSSRSVAFPKEYSFLILDFNSGTTLNEYNGYTRMQPASLTKLMTLYLIFENLENNVITLSTKLTVSAKAAAMPASKLGLKPGQTITVREIINAMIVKSANDATYVIAEFLGRGSEQNFVQLMNRQARALDLRNTHFANSTGLTHIDQYSTAYDLSILARAIMLKFSKYYRLFSQKTFTWQNKIYKSTNHLLDYQNVDGMKTGYTYAAGFNLLISSEIDGFRVIVTSMGNKSSAERDNLVKQLVNTGITISKNFRFSKIDYKQPPPTVIAANQKVQYTSNAQITNIINANSQPNDNTSDLGPVLLTSAQLDVTKTPLLNNNGNNTSLYNNPNNSDSAPLLVNSNHYIQIGVFSNINNATKLANEAITLIPLVSSDKLTIDSISTQNATLYRVRLNNLSSQEAATACSTLKHSNIACFIGTS